MPWPQHVEQKKKTTAKPCLALAKENKLCCLVLVLGCNLWCVAVDTFEIIYSLCVSPHFFFFWKRDPPQGGEETVSGAQGMNWLGSAIRLDTKGDTCSKGQQKSCTACNCGLRTKRSETVNAVIHDQLRAAQVQITKRYVQALVVWRCSILVLEERGRAASPGKALGVERECSFSCVYAVRGCTDPVAGACCRSHLQNDHGIGLFRAYKSHKGRGDGRGGMDQPV